jgi:Flp pilus assembly pilin Flp
MPQLKSFWQSEEGQDLMEYALLLAFVALTTAALVTGPMASVSAIWVDKNAELSEAASMVSSY